MSVFRESATPAWRCPSGRSAGKSILEGHRRHLGLALACALAASPIAAHAVPLLTLNESSAENLLSVKFDALGNGTNVDVPLDIGGLSTGVIPGLALTDPSLGIYIEQADGTFKLFPAGVPCSGTTNGGVLGDCVTFSKNAQGGVRVFSFASDAFDPPDTGNTETFAVGPVGAPELNVQIISGPEKVPEPPTFAVLAVGILGLGWLHGRRASARDVKNSIWEIKRGS